MSEDNDVERLTMLGEELPVRISDDDDIARKAVELVQDKLTTAEKGSQSPSNLQLALLSSLNLAGDLVKLQEKTKDQELSEETNNRLRSVSERIDNLLTEE